MRTSAKRLTRDRGVRRRRASRRRRRSLRIRRRRLSRRPPARRPPRRRRRARTTTTGRTTTTPSATDHHGRGRGREHDHDRGEPTTTTTTVGPTTTTTAPHDHHDGADDHDDASQHDHDQRVHDDDDRRVGHDRGAHHHRRDAREQQLARRRGCGWAPSRSSSSPRSSPCSASSGRGRRTQARWLFGARDVARRSTDVARTPRSGRGGDRRSGRGRPSGVARRHRDAQRPRRLRRGPHPRCAEGPRRSRGHQQPGHLARGAAFRPHRVPHARRSRRSGPASNWSAPRPSSSTSPSQTVQRSTAAVIADAHAVSAAGRPGRSPSGTGRPRAATTGPAAALGQSAVERARASSGPRSGRRRHRCWRPRPSRGRRRGARRSTRDGPRRPAGRTARARCGRSSSCTPGAAAHHRPRMPSPWWSSWNITNVFLSRTKKVGAPWLEPLGGLGQGRGRSPSPSTSAASSRPGSRARPPRSTPGRRRRSEKPGLWATSHSTPSGSGK